MNKQIDSLRASQAEKQLELREAATKRKLLALKQQLVTSVSPTLETAPPISPHHTHCTLDDTRPTPVSSPQSPSHYQLHSPPTATPLISSPDTPSQAAGVQSSTSTRNGLSALKARLMVSQDSSWRKHTASGSGGRSGRKEDVKDSTLTSTERKEVEFMSVAQRQKERVERIRRAMQAALVIQQAWRKYKSRVTGKA